MEPRTIYEVETCLDSSEGRWLTVATCENVDVVAEIVRLLLRPDNLTPFMLRILRRPALGDGSRGDPYR